MSIYDAGTASLSASGQVTGVGTQWTKPLTLIRIGATIVFKTEPVQIYTISEITSDTSISVYNPNGETAPAGTSYAILAHDGISVQGLAQDVAETLRYYQSRETEVAAAVDAFGNFDVDDFNNKVNLASSSAQESMGYRDQSQSYANDSASSASSAQASASSASGSASSAQTSASNAQTSASNAQSSASLAQSYAQSIQPSLFLTKADNLASVSNVGTARNNLNVGSAQDVSFGMVSLSNTISGLYNSGFSCSVFGGDYGLQYANPTAIAINNTETGRYITLIRVTVPDVGNPGGMDCLMDASGSSHFRINTGGGSYVFNSNGTATAVNWTSTSDIRLKKRLAGIESATEKLSSLKGYTYLKRNTLNETEETEYVEEAGLIAQDVQMVLPEAVSDVGEGSGVDYKGVNYAGVVALLVNGFNEQVAVINDLKRRIDYLESIVNSD